MFSTRKIGGFIASAGLTPWWKENFTKSDDRIVRAVFNPLGGEAGGGFIDGPKDFQDASHPGAHLASVAQCFLSKHRSIAWRLMLKAKELLERESDLWQKHVGLGDCVTGFYRVRGEYSEAYHLAQECALKQIDIAKEVMRLMLKEDKKLFENDPSFKPLHKGANRIRIDYTREKRISERDDLLDKVESLGFRVK